MKDKSGLKDANKDQVIIEMKEKYQHYFELIRRYRLDTPHIHKEYCTSNNHRNCGAIWGHSCIVIDLVCKLHWWLTGVKSLNPAEGNRRGESRKPTLQDITYKVLTQRKEGELDNEEYYWLMQVKDRCKDLLNEK